MKKSILFVLCVVVAGFALVGCSGKPEEASSGFDTTKAVPAEDGSAAAK